MSRSNELTMQVIPGATIDKIYVGLGITQQVVKFEFVKPELGLHLTIHDETKINEVIDVARDKIKKKMEQMVKEEAEWMLGKR